MAKWTSGDFIICHDQREACARAVLGEFSACHDSSRQLHSSTSCWLITPVDVRGWSPTACPSGMSILDAEVVKRPSSTSPSASMAAFGDGAV